MILKPDDCRYRATPLLGRNALAERPTTAIVLAEASSSLIFTAARGKDFPMLEAGILTIGVILTFATLAADVLYSLLNPRIRLDGAQ